MKNNIIKTTVHRAHVGNKKGWAFSVYYRPEYAGILSALFTTKKKAESELARFTKTGKLVTYGDAE